MVELTIEGIEQFLNDPSPNLTMIGTFIDEVENIVDYEAREVVRVKETTEERKEWLTKYWKDKYNIDVPDFKHEIGVRFVSVAWSSGQVHETIYDYPSSLFKSIELVEIENEEENEEEDTEDERWGWL